MFSRKTRNYFPIFIIFADILLVVFLIWLVIQTSSLSSQNALLKRQSDDAAAKKNQLFNNRIEAGRISDSLEILNGYFISPEEKFLVIDNLEKLASIAHITYILNNAIDGEQVSLDLSVKGPFQNIYHFMRLLETGGYWVSFEKILLSRGVEANKVNWTGSIVISIPNASK